MTYLIYRSPREGVRVYLTTESTDSHYGIPVLRLVGPGYENWPDLGPAGILPNGRLAAEVVAQLVTHGKPPAGYGGSCPKSVTSRKVRAAAHAFLSQWPEGPMSAEGE